MKTFSTASAAAPASWYAPRPPTSATGPSTLFEEPDGIRVAGNHVPGKGHLGPEGRLGGGKGPADQYGEDGLTDS